MPRERRRARGPGRSNRASARSHEACARVPYPPRNGRQMATASNRVTTDGALRASRVRVGSFQMGDSRRELIDYESLFPRSRVSRRSFSLEVSLRGWAAWRSRLRAALVFGRSGRIVDSRPMRADIVAAAFAAEASLAAAPAP